MLLLLLLGCVIGVHAYSEEPGGCDNFHKGLACPLNPGNIVSANSGLENEVLCQSACGEDDRCNFFTFMEFNTTRDSLCVLQVSCDVEAATFCNDEPGCSFAVAGPASPTILDVCCAEFEHKECDTEAPIATVPNVGEEWMCQELCRNDLTCSFYTLFINVCFLHKLQYNLSVRSLLKWFCLPYHRQLSPNINNNGATGEHKCSTSWRDAIN